jgi:hypothetical protein
VGRNSHRHSYRYRRGGSVREPLSLIHTCPARHGTACNGTIKHCIISLYEIIHIGEYFTAPAQTSTDHHLKELFDVRFVPVRVDPCRYV